MDYKATVNVDEELGVILNCAVRYSLGRRTYMPLLVVDYITPLLSALDDRTLCVFDQDVSKAKYEGGYGDDSVDAPRWVRFLNDVRKEEASRGLKPYKDWRETDEH